MSTSGTITSYVEVGVKEDVSEIITNISPTKTPFQTMIGNVPVWNTFYQWQEDQLLSPASNAQVEGAAAITAVSQPTVMRFNTTQILEKVAQTADTLDALKFHGRDRELAYQLAMRSAELKRDLEFAYVGSAAVGTASSSGAGGSTSSARILNGYQQQIALSNSGSYTAPVVLNGVTASAAGIAALTGSTSVTLTEAMINSISQTLFVNGVDPDTVMVTPTDAMSVVNFINTSGTNRTRFLDNGDKAAASKLINVIDVYVNPFATLKVVINRFLRTGDCLVYTPDMWKKAALRNWTRTTLAKTGDFTQVMLVGEFGLQHRNFFASGLITGLA